MVYNHHEPQYFPQVKLMTKSCPFSPGCTTRLHFPILLVTSISYNWILGQSNIDTSSHALKQLCEILPIFPHLLATYRRSSWGLEGTELQKGTNVGLWATSQRSSLIQNAVIPSFSTTLLCVISLTRSLNILNRKCQT